MRKQYTSRATLFFMELVIVIFFFAICAAICVNVFGTAQQMARESDSLSKAVLEVRSAASCYKAAEGKLDETAELLCGDMQDACLTVYYDTEWKKTEVPYENGFMLCVEEREQAGEADIFVINLQTEALIFSLPVKTGGGGMRYEAE